MKRQKNKNFSRASAAVAKTPDFIRREKSIGNVKILASGMGLLCGAFFVLRWANPEGNNFAAHATPFIFILSWAVILAGILWEDKKEEAEKKGGDTVNSVQKKS
ncbi:hypothetical protein KJ633_02415 [bacterium]|nr:hypothetical protein [bacterium]MBU3955293.1 hypothetical protein [bacterium]